MLIGIDRIKIKKRIRVEVGDLKPLMESLKKYGLFHPVTINSRYELISGFRRLQSAKKLGWTEIDVKIVDALTKEALIERELEENLLRKDFTDEELHEGYLLLSKLQNPNWLIKLLRKIINFFKKLFIKKAD